jgi:hypothetical protein
MWFATKVLISALIVACASWLAGRKPVVAGFIVALPIISMLSILFSYLEYRDMERVNQFAVSILVAVPLSLAFFVPFVMNRWLKLDFLPTYLLAFGAVAVAYVLHSLVFKYGWFRY